METLESLRNKTNGARDLKSVVRSMKAMAASNIGQYELAVASLEDYFNTVALGFIAYLKEEAIDKIYETDHIRKNKDISICAIVFGSDQGLVGQFNDSMADYIYHSFKLWQGEKEIWVVGERLDLLLSDSGLKSTVLYQVPNSVGEITSLIEQIVIKLVSSYEKDTSKEFYIFQNQPKKESGYQAVMQRLLPFDEKWRLHLATLQWPTKNLPQIAGCAKPTLSALISEYLFVSLFKGCAESLASENTSRLIAMQRAEKNINDLLVDLTNKFHRLRQSSIDEELFDVISGFEALKTQRTN
jgi:F-type H+-transporting ATPase subunit gamma